MLNSIRIEDVTNVKSGIEVVKIIRTAARISLWEAKDLWDKSKFAPVEFESVALTSDDTKLLLEKYGCKVSIINISPTSREVLESQVRNLGGRIIWGDISSIDDDNLKIKNPAGVHPIYRNES